MIHNTPLSRKYLWVRFIAQAGGEVRVLRCFHCRTKERVNLWGRDAISRLAKVERRFVAAHKNCAAASLTAPHPFNLSQGNLARILRWAARQEGN